MVDAFSGVFRIPNIGPFMGRPITMLLEGVCPDYPDWVVTLVSPHIEWWNSGFNSNTVAWWAAAALAVPYTEEVGQSVVDTLLQIASVDGLRPYIPVDVWALLKRRPSLPPVCRGRFAGTEGSIVHRVRELGDVDILESYLLLVWSEWHHVDLEGVTEMGTSIREDLSGLGMGHHREVLIKRLDHVLGQLGRGFQYLSQHNPILREHHILVAKQKYKDLQRILLDVDRGALDILTRTSFKLINSFNSLMRPQNPTRRSFAFSLYHARSRASITLAPRSPNSVLHLPSGSTPPPLRAPSILSIVTQLFNHTRLPQSPGTRNPMP